MAALIVSFAVLAIGYSVAIPSGEGVDEAAHFDYVRYVKERLALPIQPMTREQGVEVWMGHHPPLYYVLGALAISWIDTSDFAEAFRPNRHFVWRENDARNGWNVMMHFGQDDIPWRGSILALHVLRLMNVALAAVTIYATYKAATLLLPERFWFPLGVTAVVAFNPSFIYMTSTVHHDVLQAMLFALAIWWIMRFLNKPERPYDAVLAGLLLAAAMLTKLSGAVLALLIGIVLLAKFLQDRDWRDFFRRATVVYGIALLVAGWWYIRNQHLYGDPLGWQMFLDVHSHMVRPGPYTRQVFTDEFLAQIGRTYWGGFGFMHITFPENTKYLWWLTGLGFIGFLIAAYRRQLLLRERWAQWAATGALMILLFASFVRFSIATVGAGHGRYLFPAAFAVGVVIVAGWNGLAEWRYQRIISITLAVGLLVFAIWLPVTQVLPKYAAPLTITEAQLSSESNALDVQIADGVRLVGYKLDSNWAIPGQTLQARLFWSAFGDPAKRQDPQVRLEIVNEEDISLAAVTTWPVQSLSPDVWSPDDIYVPLATLTLPPEELSDTLRLTASPIHRSTDEQDAPQRILLHELSTYGRSTLTDPDQVPNPRREELAGMIGLAGFDVSPEIASPGDTILVDLYWDVREQPPADYTAFVHLLNGQGDLVSQLDRLAGGNVAPSSSWLAGQMIRDRYPVKIPEGTPPGTYTLEAGLYIWPSLDRLPVTLGGEPKDDSISLTTYQITP